MEVQMTDVNYIDPEITQDDKTWALLSYLFTPIVPIIILLIEDKKNRPFLKSHYVQALAWGVVLYVVSGVLTPIFFIGCAVGIAAIVFSVLWGIKAYNGEQVVIPIITDFVKKQGWA